jgi:hypothetical protein
MVYVSTPHPLRGAWGGRKKNASRTCSDCEYAPFEIMRQIRARARER